MELIKPLALILSFVGFCLTFGAHKEIGRFRAPFITCCAIALSLFFCGLLGVLKNGTLMICATGIALFAVQLWGRIRDRQLPVPTFPFHQTLSSPSGMSSLSGRVAQKLSTQRTHSLKKTLRFFSRTIRRYSNYFITTSCGF
jgi:hypothetical protein